ncbi:MAG: hypothetical protein GY793_00245 [Proteobacteria bacterium]|nr:hypothetical protein [Pseudomonadota bacterium]
MINSRKGAMFGLDARVALAIFGALSVITGAALYSSIQDAKVVAIATEMDNIDKAITELLIDTGSYPVVASTTTSGELQTEDLIIATSSTSWRGPYIGFADDGDADDGILDHPNYGTITTYRHQDVDWDTPASGTLCQSTSDSCSVYICYTNIAEDINAAIDAKIDGTNDADTGNYRYLGTVGCKRGLTYDVDLVT